MIDTATKHNKTDALASLDRIRWANPADNASGKITCNLHYSMTSSLRIGDLDQIALILFTGRIAECGTKVTGSMVNPDNLSGNGSPVDVNVKRRHENGDPMTRGAVTTRYWRMRDIADLPISSGKENLLSGRGRLPVGIAKKGGNRHADEKHRETDPEQVGDDENYRGYADAQCKRQPLPRDVQCLRGAFSHRPPARSGP